jgi:hypothetical protein
MYEDLITYRMRKVIYSIIFNFYENDYEDKEDFDLITVESLRNVVEYLASENYLSESVKNNINNYLMRARYFEDENRTKRIELINDTIGFMNRQQCDNSLIFYRLQLFDRRREFKYLFKLTNEEIKKEIENVHDSICNDLYVIIGQSNLTSDEEFEKEYLPFFKNTNIYYESLNIFLKENPTIFKDEIFYNRMMKVINLNNEICNDKEVFKMNKKLLKKIDKKIK